jgi:hypothetical protein
LVNEVSNLRYKTYKKKQKVHLIILNRMLYLRKCGELYDEKHMMTGRVIEKAKITRDYLRKVTCFKIF